MDSSNPVDTTTCKYTTLSKKMSPTTEDDKKMMENKPYAQVVGTIMYVMLCTRPDLSYVVSLVSGFRNYVGEAHWSDETRIMTSLKGQKITS